ncbi:AMP-binding protein, partial [Thalassospira sp.]|uniref:AMP-binding protein n=1 Tax=Thalassospira sp. TaxID=1912094 RepID=UPI00311FD582
MTRLTDFRSYGDAQKHFSRDALWALFDGTRDDFNIAHECVDRHVDGDNVAVRVAHSEGRDEVITFVELAKLSSQFAHYLAGRGVGKGDRVAVMLEPSLAFYGALFGAIKLGAVAVPMFTLFGPEGIRLRADDCQPSVLFTNEEKAGDATAAGNLDVVIVNDGFLNSIASLPTEFACNSAGDDLAVLQYTSGTTRLLPAAVKHTHRSLVTLMVAALYATVIRPGDRFFCPSS